MASLKCSEFDCAAPASAIDETFDENELISILHATGPFEPEISLLPRE